MPKQSKPAQLSIESLYQKKRIKDLPKRWQELLEFEVEQILLIMLELEDESQTFSHHALSELYKDNMTEADVYTTLEQGELVHIGRHINTGTRRILIKRQFGEQYLNVIVDLDTDPRVEPLHSIITCWLNDVSKAFAMDNATYSKAPVPPWYILGFSWQSYEDLVQKHLLKEKDIERQLKEKF